MTTGKLRLFDTKSNLLCLVCRLIVSVLNTEVFKTDPLFSYYIICVIYIKHIYFVQMEHLSTAKNKQKN